LSASGSGSGSARRRNSLHPPSQHERDEHRSRPQSYALPTAASSARKGLPTNQTQSTEPDKLLQRARGSVSLMHAASAAARRKAYDEAHGRYATLRRAKSHASGAKSVALDPSSRHSTARSRQTQPATKPESTPNVPLQPDPPAMKTMASDTSNSRAELRHDEPMPTIAFADMLRNKTRPSSQRETTPVAQLAPQVGDAVDDDDEDDWGDMDEFEIGATVGASSQATLSSTSARGVHHSANEGATLGDSPTHGRRVESQSSRSSGQVLSAGEFGDAGGGDGKARDVTDGLMRADSARNHHGGPTLLEFCASPALAETETKVGEVRVVWCVLYSVALL
jgi:hypothetical protein